MQEGAIWPMMKQKRYPSVVVAATPQQTRWSFDDSADATMEKVICDCVTYAMYYSLVFFLCVGVKIPCWLCVRYRSITGSTHTHRLQKHSFKTLRWVSPLHTDLRRWKTALAYLMIYSPWRLNHSIDELVAPMNQSKH
mmetsp:Transcript_15905/g.23432  ORF Transcript_15905/g.23432 Transcript_15905/m.23432 type:complete len:138 (-) Transcript_15905:2069-2482(-)